MGYDERLDAGRRLIAAGRWTEACSELSAALAENETAQVHDLLGGTLWWMGEIRASLRHRERAFAAYLDEGSPAPATTVALDISVCYLSNLDNDAAARGWLARANRVAESSGDDRLVGWVLLVSGYTSTDPDMQRTQLERALTVARSRADVDLELVALADLGLALVATGELEAGFGLLDEAMAGTQGGGFDRLETVVWTSCSMLAACSMVGDLHRARQWCDAADAFMDEYGCPFLQARCRAHYGRVLVATGQWEAAERELQNALSMSEDTGQGPRSEALTGLAELRLRQGRFEEAETMLDHAEGVPATVARAELSRLLGRPEQAAAVLAAVLETLTHDEPDRAQVLAALVDADLGRGDPDSARRHVEALEQLRRGHQLPAIAGLAARAAGLVAAAEGRSADAARQLRVAAAAFSAQDLGYDAARARLELATVLSDGQPELATVEAEAAYRRLDELGAHHDLDEAAALLRRLGVPTRPGPRGLGLLSQREVEVLALLERGLTNPQIAERLFISRKTAAHHVSSILLKLGLESRAEAAAYAVRHRVTRPVS